MPFKLREKLSGIARTISTDRSNSRTRSSACPPEKSFISKYLDGELDHQQTEVPVVDYARDAGQLPEVPLSLSAGTGESDLVLAAYTGPDGGLTAIVQQGAISASSECLSDYAGGDIGFIDASSASSSADSVRQLSEIPLTARSSEGVRVDGGSSRGDADRGGLGGDVNGGGCRALAANRNKTTQAPLCKDHGCSQCILCSKRIRQSPFPSVVNRKLVTTLSLPLWSSAPPSPPLMSPPVLCEEAQEVRRWGNSAGRRNDATGNPSEFITHTNGVADSGRNCSVGGCNWNADEEEEDDDDAPGTFYYVGGARGASATNYSNLHQINQVSSTNKAYASQVSTRKSPNISGRTSDHNGNFSGANINFPSGTPSIIKTISCDKTSTVSECGTEIIGPDAAECQNGLTVASGFSNGGSPSCVLLTSTLPVSASQHPSNSSGETFKNTHAKSSSVIASNKQTSLKESTKESFSLTENSESNRIFSVTDESTHQASCSDHETDSISTGCYSDTTKTATLQTKNAVSAASSVKTNTNLLQSTHNRWYITQRVSQGQSDSPHDLSHQSSSTSAQLTTHNGCESSSVGDNNTTVNQPDSDENVQHMSNEEVLAVSADREIASVYNWNRPSDQAFGSSLSLYECNYSTGQRAGNPVADVFGVVARTDAGILAVADGVNWGSAARTAARSAVHGCLDYLNRALFGPTTRQSVQSSNDVFLALLRSFHSAHGVILQQRGMLTTLTAAVVLPSGATYNHDGDAPYSAQQKYLVCVCNVGDSLAYVYSQKHGVREITRGSHDVHSVRDMRDALGALGPVTGRNPELNNLTLAMTQVEAGDIVFLTSDGVSDNFDPVVGKFVTAKHSTSDLDPDRPQLLPEPNRHSMGPRSSAHWPRWRCFPEWASGKMQSVASGVRRVRPQRASSASVVDTLSPKDRSQRAKSCHQPPSCPSYTRSTADIPSVSAYQRHELTLLRMNDVLRHGAQSDTDWPADDDPTLPVRHARHLCGRLLNFVSRLTAAKRRVLEDPELGVERAVEGRGGVRVGSGGDRKWSKQEQHVRRRMLCEQLAAVPGKLDHATVVAYQAGRLGTRLAYETAL